MMTPLKVEWIDHKREPENPPNPDCPNGVGVNLAGKAKRSCATDLPYPAKRCGMYVITCMICGLRVGQSTAGRADDPRHIRVACKIQGPTQ